MTSFVPVFEFSNPFLIWIFFTFYISNMITYGFLISVLFASTSMAVTVGWLFFIFTILFYNGVCENFALYNYLAKIFFNLMVNFNLGAGIDLILYAEKYQEGVGFVNFFDRDVVMKFSFGELLICMLCSSIFNIFLTIYIENVFPGKYGVAEPWYFPVKLFVNKWYKRRITRAPDYRDDSRSDFEKEPKDLKIGIKIDELGKKIDEKIILRNLTLNVYEGQITILLGEF